MNRATELCTLYRSKLQFHNPFKIHTQFFLNSKLISMKLVYQQLQFPYKEATIAGASGHQNNLPKNINIKLSIQFTEILSVN